MKYTQAASIDLGLLRKVQFSAAKRRWGISFALRFSAVALGIASLWFSEVAQLALPFLSLLAAASAALTAWWGETFRRRAEAIQRRLELHDGLGIAIGEKDRLDFLASTSQRHRSRSQTGVRDSYWASIKRPGPERLLENLYESAWWSSQLASRAFKLFLTVGILLSTFAFIAVVAAALLEGSHSTRVQASRFGAALIGFVITGDILRVAAGYHVFSQHADKCATRANAAPPAQEPMDGLPLLHDYQVARSAAPPLPDWLHRLHAQALNHLWSTRKN